MPPCAAANAPTRSPAAPVNAPLHVAEQVALDQRLGRRAAVEHDERPLLARRRVVDAARHQLLAGAALAEEQHRRARLRARARGSRTPGASRSSRRTARRSDRAPTAGCRRPRRPASAGSASCRSAARAGRRDDLADRDAVDHRAVLRAEVGDREALRARRDRAVAARHERIGRARRRSVGSVPITTPIAGSSISSPRSGRRRRAAARATHGRRAAATFVDSRDAHARSSGQLTSELAADAQPQRVELDEARASRWS